ncbi:uncharacterized protein M421DRAFT_103015 [Didymella exigua CBS 183.55]|uniref:Uncharacterized protein n=1 Tax=Didymella exigua CBS 183.55 TaxID=1150837 RepID=A0A6A5RE14_9PLEO|nr:uncharacterized protein M421DRAFT_103015 [Didymella exigua CBS 183.55]KAF1925703.1 hypothetical protein M421DRAFT_103015 [Didymella exigua CBS 183.55]
MSWLPELVAVVVSVGSLLAIFAVLRREDGKPISEWSLVVPLNAVIAILGALARTTLAFALSACIGQQKWNWLRVRPDHLVAWTRFDEASRGPWGATRLFVWLRLRHWAALGALVIVGTVAFDPFLQAVLTTAGGLDVDQLAEYPARLPQALLVDTGPILELTTQGGLSFFNTSVGLLTKMGGFTVQPDFGMISAIYNGFRNSTTRDPVTSSYRTAEVVNSVCTTGNCTWPRYTSAAICSSCNDVSTRITLDQRTGTGGSSIPGPFNQVYGPSRYTAFTLQNANLSNDDTARYDPDSGSKGGIQPTLLTTNISYDARDTIRFRNLSTMIASFTIMKAGNDWLGGKVAWNASKPTATECALYFCANMYKAETRNGKLVETVIGSWSNRDPNSYQVDQNSGTVDVTGEKAAVEAYLAEHVGNMLYDTVLQRTDLRLDIPEEESPDVMSFTRSFNISYAYIISMTDFLKTLTARTSGVRSTDQMVYPEWDGGESPLVNALWDSGNLTQTFDNVALSLTNQIRNTAIDSPRYHEASGDTLKWVIHVRVQWPYLAFPIAMITLGILYVFLTIVESTRLHIPVWKEAALPSLLYGLDNETQSLLREAHKKSVMTVRYRLDEKDDCL